MAPSPTRHLANTLIRTFHTGNGAPSNLRMHMIKKGQPPAAGGGAGDAMPFSPGQRPEITIGRGLPAALSGSCQEQPLDWRPPADSEAAHPVRYLDYPKEPDSSPDQQVYRSEYFTLVGLSLEKITRDKI